MATPSSSSFPTGLSPHLNLPALLSPTFTPTSHANTLLHRTTPTASTDPPGSIDLTTPLSRALFDAQEIDAHVHSLTARHAVPMLTWLERQTASAERVSNGLQGKADDHDGVLGQYAGGPGGGASGLGLKAVNETYARLEQEVLGRYERAERLGRAAGNGVRTMRVLREVNRALLAARRVEAAVVESGLGTTTPGKGLAGKEDHERLVEAARAVLGFREVLFASSSSSSAAAASGSTSNGTHDKGAPDIGEVTLIRQVRGKIVEDDEEKIRDWARKAVREFNASSSTAGQAGSLFRDADLSRRRFTSACRILYLLSPVSPLDRARPRRDFEPDLLLRSLQAYVQGAVQASGAGIARGLAALPQLERALAEVSARCQSLVAMERVLEGIAEPAGHPSSLLPHESATNDVEKEGEGEGEGQDEDEEDEEKPQRNLLTPLLRALDTSSLPSFFWRSLANGLGARVHEILARGGVSARTLRSNRDGVRDAIRECVARGSRMPMGMAGGGVAGGSGVVGETETVAVGNWEREAAVMVGAVLGALAR